MAKREAPPPWQAWSVAGLMILAFAVGGCGVILSWPMFWAGVGLLVVSVLLGWRIRLMEFTEEYAIHGQKVEPGTTRFHG